jgi:hypothetical protein
MALLQADGELAAPGNADQEGAEHRLSGVKRGKVLADVVKQTAKSWSVTARFLIAPGAAPVEKRDGETGVGENAA